MRPTLSVLTLALLAAVAHGEYLTYEEFVEQVEKGNVKAVTVDRYSKMHGTYLVDGKEQPFETYAGTGSANDPLLIGKLKSEKVAVTLDQAERDPFGWGGLWPMVLLTWGVPLITLILVYRVSRRVTKIQKALQAPNPPDGQADMPPSSFG